MGEGIPETVLVTGPTKGIGLGIALTLAAQGKKLILASRTEENLRETARDCFRAGASKVTIVPADLSTAQGQELVYEACRWFPRDEFGLYLNAGAWAFDEELRSETNPEGKITPAYVHNLNAAATGFLLEKLPAALAVLVLSTAAVKDYDNCRVYSRSKRAAEQHGLEAVMRGQQVLFSYPGNTDTDGAASIVIPSVDKMKAIDLGAYIANMPNRAVTAELIVPVPGVQKQRIPFDQRTYIAQFSVDFPYLVEIGKVRSSFNAAKTQAFGDLVSTHL